MSALPPDMRLDIMRAPSAIWSWDSSGIFTPLQPAAGLPAAPLKPLAKYTRSISFSLPCIFIDTATSCCPVSGASLISPLLSISDSCP